MLKEVTAFAERASDKALSMLKRDGYLLPVLLFMKKDGNLLPAMVGDSEEGADISDQDVPQILKEASLDCNAIIYVCNSSEDTSPKLLSTVIYHPLGTEVRKVVYLKGQDDITLMDMGWSSMTTDPEGFFPNPFRTDL